MIHGGGAARVEGFPKGFFVQATFFRPMLPTRCGSPRRRLRPRHVRARFLTARTRSSPAPTQPNSDWPPACSPGTSPAPTASLTRSKRHLLDQHYNRTPVEAPFGGSKRPARRAELNGGDRGITVSSKASTSHPPRGEPVLSEAISSSSAQAARRFALAYRLSEDGRHSVLCWC